MTDIVKCLTFNIPNNLKVNNFMKLREVWLCSGSSHCSITIQSLMHLSFGAGDFLRVSWEIHFSIYARKKRTMNRLHRAIERLCWQEAELFKVNLQCAELQLISVTAHSSQWFSVILKERQKPGELKSPKAIQTYRSNGGVITRRNDHMGDGYVEYRREF